jgi:hypothetical protein
MNRDDYFPSTEALKSMFLWGGFIFTFGLLLFLGQVEFLDIVKFYIFVLGVLVIPQLYLLHLFKISAKKIDRMVLTIGGGFIIQTVAFYLFSLFGLRPAYVVLLVFTNISYGILVLRNKLKGQIVVSHKDDPSGATWTPYFFIASLSVLILYFLYVLRNGSVTDGYMYFYRSFTDDGLFHIGNAAQLLHSPAIMIKDIHYIGSSFYYHDFSLYFIALISYLTGIELVTTYCKLYFPLIGFVLTLSLWSLSFNLYKREGICLILIFIIFFSHNLSFIVPVGKALFLRDIDPLFGLPITISGVFLDRGPGTLLHNPSHPASITVLILGCYAFLKALEDKGKFFLILSIVCFSTLVKFRMTTYVVAMAGLFFTSVLFFYRGERIPFKIFAGSALLAIPFCLPYLPYFRVLSNTRRAITFKPLEVIARHGAKWRSGRLNFPGIEIIDCFMLFLGMFWLRWIGIYYWVRKSFRNWKGMSGIEEREAMDPRRILEFVFLFSLLFGTAISIFFDFPGSDLFLMVGLTLFSVYVAKAIYEVFNYTKLHGAVIAGMLFVAVLSFTHYVTNNAYEFEVLKISQEEVDALRYLRDNSEKHAVVLGKRFDKVLTSGITDEEKFYQYSAFSERQMVDEGNKYGNRHIPKEVRRKRREDIQEFYSTQNRDKALGLIRKYGFNYVLLEKGESLHYDTKGILEPFFENEELRILRVLPLSSS